MGVTGLWRLIEPAGKPVPIETLENKVLAVDISIWLHQMVKGYQDAKGAPLANAHLMGLFQRLCKLLYFRIKPVFVFDGAFPALKRETINKRQDAKQKYNSESERIKRELAILLTKKTAIGSFLGKQISPKKASNPTVQTDEELFKLPALPALPQNEDEESESDDDESSSSSSIDLHSIDLESQNFKSLPTREKYDLLIELKETRKMNSWGKLHELPKKSDNFSDFQLERLLKRRKVQECLQETEKEMGHTGMSLNELESLLNEEGIDTKIENLPTRRIASSNTTRFFLINDVKQALAEAKQKEEGATLKCSGQKDPTNTEAAKTDELAEDLEKAIKMSLECTNKANEAGPSKTDDSWTSYVSDGSEYFKTDSEEEEGCDPPDMTSAKNYIMQYSDYTIKTIDNITRKTSRNKSKGKKKTKMDEIIKDLNFGKSQMVETGANLSCSEDDCPNIDFDVEVATISSDDEMVNATQASVVVENPTQEVISLDSSFDTVAKPKKDQHCSGPNYQNKDGSISGDDDLVEVSEIESIIEHKIDTNSTEASEEKPSHEIVSLKSDGNTVVESDSTDDDLEDVPDIDNKPVVELTLKVNETMEDDIFADVFTTSCNKIQGSPVTPNIETKTIDIKEVINEEDDELQKAIMMSLECVGEEESIPNKMNISDSEERNTEKPVSPVKDIITKIVQDNTKVSKTQKSLNEILSAETPKRGPDVTEKDAVKLGKTNILPISKEQLNSMVEDIQSEERGLEKEKGGLDRIGRNITEQMTKEAQELLQIFGIPYIVAPMEAEAQCAFLESVNLTDGTITDDSDIWLFGGRTVYKNFFNQKKHVLQFLAEKIEKSFKLNREQLILLALLVGSDYTTGIDGVGPVTAMEILASFPFKRRMSDDQQSRHTQIITGLQEFKQWVRGGKRTDNTTLKKKLRNISLNEDFPSVRVVQAYLEPNVEKSKDKFSWGELDITILRDYAKAKFGWSQHKLDEIVKPVLKRMVERKTQRSMQDFFKRKTEFESLEDQMSKRVKAAVLRIGPKSGGPEENIGREELKEKIEREELKEKQGKRKGKVKDPRAGPSKPKKKKTEDSVLKNLSVKVVTELKDGKSEIDIKINKTDRFQEIIPQREKDKQCLLQNKMKAIELFRKTNIDKKKNLTKRKPLIPKDRADLSESSDSN